MIFWIKTASLFLIRSKRTSVILTLMVIIAVSSLIFLASLAVGVNDAMIRNSTGLFSGHITGFDIPDNIEKTELSQKGIQNVLKRIPVAGFLHSKDKIELTTLIGIDPLQEKRTAAFTKKVIKGRFLNQNTNELLISHATATKLNLNLDDIVGFSEKPLSQKTEFKITGIFKTGLDQFDKGISFCFSEAVIDKKNTWNAAIFLKPGMDTDLILNGYKTGDLKNIDFKTWKQSMPDLEQLINLNYVSMSIVIVIVFIVVSLGITSAFFIFIFKSIREYGIMKVMGITAKETFFLLFFEVFLINITASFIGIIIGSAIVFIFNATGLDISSYTSHNQYFIVSGIIYPRLTFYSLLFPPVFALIFSLPAAIWPALTVIRQDAADILRGR